MNYIFLLAGLLLASGQAGAQAPRPAARPDSLTAPLATSPAAPDTVAALHRLFAAKRKRNLNFVAGTAGVAAVGGVVIGTSPSGFNGIDQGVIGIAIIALGSFPALVAEALTAVDYNKKSEQRAVEDFQAHKLPNYLKSKLKSKYFRQGA